VTSPHLTKWLSRCQVCVHGDPWTRHIDHIIGKLNFPTKGSHCSPGGFSGRFQADSLPSLNGAAVCAHSACRSMMDFVGDVGLSSLVSSSDGAVPDH
jgi:hypothetical protein